MWAPAVLLLVFAPACCGDSGYFYGDYDVGSDSDFYDAYEDDQTTTSALLTTTTELRNSQSIQAKAHTTVLQKRAFEQTRTHTAWDTASLQIKSVTVDDTKPILTTTPNYVQSQKLTDIKEKETSTFIQFQEMKDVKVVEVILPVLTTTPIKTSSILGQKKTLNSPEMDNKAEISSTMLTTPMNNKKFNFQHTSEINGVNNTSIAMDAHTRKRRYDSDTQTMNPKVMKEVKNVLKDLMKARRQDNEDNHYAAFDMTKTTNAYDYLEYKTIGRKTLNAQDIKDVEVVLKHMFKNRKMNWTTSSVTTKTVFTGVFDYSDKFPTSTTTFGSTWNQTTDYSQDTTTATGVEISSTLNIDKIVNWEPIDNTSLKFVRKQKSTVKDQKLDDKSLVFERKPQENETIEDKEEGKLVEDKLSLLFIRKAKNLTDGDVETATSSTVKTKLASNNQSTHSTVMKPTRSGKPDKDTKTISRNTDILKGFLLPDVMNTSPSINKEKIDLINKITSVLRDARNFNDRRDILKSFLNKTFARDDGETDIEDTTVLTTPTPTTASPTTLTTTLPTTTTLTTTVTTTTKHVCPTLYAPTTTTATPLTTDRATVRLDVDGLLALIANLTYEYDMNLTQRFNETLIKYSVPTCPTPTTTAVPTTTVPEYNFANTSVVGKCFVCGLDKTAIPQDAYCGDAFAGDFLPLVPQDPRARGQIARYRKYCRFLDVRNYLENPEEPRAVYGRFTGGCSVRWTDLSNVYTQRTCRNKRRAVMGKHFASKRMAKLEMALRSLDNGCIISPMATLLPLSRGISLYARFHACVCTGAWCNRTIRWGGEVWVLLLINVVGWKQFG